MGVNTRPRLVVLVYHHLMRGGDWGSSIPGILFDFATSALDKATRVVCRFFTNAISPVENIGLVRLR